MIAFALAVVLVIGLSLLIGRSISGAIASMVSAMTRLAKGDLRIAIPGLGRRDEIGEMAGAVEVFKNSMTEAERLRAEQRETEQRQLEQRKADMRELADAFEGAVGEIVETVSSAATELEASANTLTKAAERSQNLATVVAAASEEASTNVQSVSAASEELNASVNEISRQVQELSRVASEAVDQAQETNNRVSALSLAAEPYRRRGRIDQHHCRTDQPAGAERDHRSGARRRSRSRLCRSGVGSESACRTDGESDRRNQPADIGHSGRHPGLVGAIKAIGNTIGRMSEISSTIASSVEEQGAATQEISRNIQHAAEGTQQVSSNIAEVQHGATETGSASAQVHSAAKSLSSESNRLKLEVGKFLNSVRAA